MVVVFLSFLYIPVDGFERCALVPEPPKVFAWLLTVGRDIVVIAVLPKPFSKLLFFFSLSKASEYCSMSNHDTNIFQTVTAFLCSLVLAMEEVSGSVCR